MNVKMSVFVILVEAIIYYENKKVRDIVKDMAFSGSLVCDWERI